MVVLHKLEYVSTLH